LLLTLTLTLFFSLRYEGTLALVGVEDDAARE